MEIDVNLLNPSNMNIQLSKPKMEKIKELRTSQANAEVVNFRNSVIRFDKLF